MLEQGPLVAEIPEPADASGLVGVVPADERWRHYGPRPSWFRKHVLGVREEPPVSYVGCIVPPRADHTTTGICCSGGGIRSASFNLGVLQAIQEAGRLQQAHYLAAVSGGSYIAAAFAMVSKTEGEDGDDSDARLLSPSRSAFYPGSPEEQYLRNRVSYMAPAGVDKALLVWRVILGLVVNLLLIAATVTIIAAVLSLYYRHADPGLIRPPRHGEHGASPNGAIWGAGLGIASVGIALGAAAIVLRPSQNGGVLHQLERWAPRFFALGLGLFALELVVPVLIDLMRKDQGGAPVQHPRTVGAGITASVAAILGAILTQIRRPLTTPVKAVEAAQDTMRKLPARLRLAVVYLATGIVGPGLVLALLIGSTMIQVENSSLGARVLLPVGALVLLGVVFRVGDLNSWSLHPFYRQRLCTAFALRRVADEGDPPAPELDDDALPRPRGHAEPRELAERVPLHKTRVVPKTPPFRSSDWPELIVCAAANVSDPGASPPGRGVTSFTFTTNELGGPLVGGVATQTFIDKLGKGRSRDFSLPAVVAMSGAAISPSMGKATRPSVRFLLAMANVRLGVWIPNPRRMESFVRMRSALGQQRNGIAATCRALLRPSTWEAEERASALESAAKKTRWMPRPTPYYLFKELMGRNSVNDKFLYVSDGGHYENLGLVELLRRGCTRIYCFDAGGGVALSELGDAIALARSEIGVEMCFEPGALEALQEDPDTGLAEKSCAVGKLRYQWPEEVTGTIVYARTAMTADLPWDVQAFRRHDPCFPHHSALDQLFTDQKFEAYRVLGVTVGNAAMKAMDATASG